MVDILLPVDKVFQNADFYEGEKECHLFHQVSSLRSNRFEFRNYARIFSSFSRDIDVTRFT